MARNAAFKDFSFSTDKNLLQLDVVCGFMARSHWAAKRSRAVVERSLQHSECYGIYLHNRQVGFARVVTDYCTFAYLCDVFIDEEFRGQGLSKFLMEFIMSDASYASLRRFVLATKDAHELYKKYGFELLNETEKARFMEILKVEN